jgi:hypothetical protein
MGLLAFDFSHPTATSATILTQKSSVSSADGPYVAGTGLAGQPQVDAELGAVMHQMIDKHPR